MPLRVKSGKRDVGKQLECGYQHRRRVRGALPREAKFPKPYIHGRRGSTVTAEWHFGSSFLTLFYGKGALHEMGRKDGIAVAAAVSRREERRGYPWAEGVR